MPALRLLSALLLATLVPATAQELTLEFVCLPKSSEPVSLKLPIGDGKVLDLEIGSNEVTQPVKVPRLAEYRLGTFGADEEGNQVFRTHAKAAPLAATRQLFVLLRRGKSPADGFQVVPIASGSSGFGAKQFLVMNLTGQKIAADVGSVRFGLNPGQSKVISPKPEAGKSYCYADLRYESKERWRPFFTSNWPLQEKRRGLIFVYQKPGSARPRLHTIVDVFP